jgi:hypothetical protein
MLPHLLRERSLRGAARFGANQLRRNFFRCISFETIFTFARIAVRQCQGHAHPARPGSEIGKALHLVMRAGVPKIFRAAQNGRPKTTKPPCGGSSFTSSHLPNWKVWSGRRDSNPRPRPWQGRALPLSYTRIREVAAIARHQRADLCQMPPVNATVWRRNRIGPISARLDRFHGIPGNPRPNRAKSGQAGFPRLQIGPSTAN